MRSFNDLLNELKNKKVMVLGSSGYIGSKLVNELINNDINYFGIDKLESDFENTLCFNLCEKNKIDKVIKENTPDYIINCATYSALAYQKDFKKCFEEDIIAIINIINALSNFPEVRMIYFSSSYIYSGLSPDTKVTEESPLKPKHNFGVAKSFFEQFVLRNHPNSVVFRLSSAFGTGKYLHPNAVAFFVNECLEKGKLTVWGTGKRMMQYVYNEDVIKNIINGLFLEPGLYNLGGDDYISVAETSRILAEHFNIEVEFLNNKKEGETLPFMDNEKLKKVNINVEFTPFKDAITEYLKTIK